MKSAGGVNDQEAIRAESGEKKRGGPPEEHEINGGEGKRKG